MDELIKHCRGEPERSPTEFGENGSYDIGGPLVFAFWLLEKTEIRTFSSRILWKGEIRGKHIGLRFQPG